MAVAYLNGILKKVHPTLTSIPVRSRSSFYDFIFIFIFIFLFVPLRSPDILISDLYHLVVQVIPLILLSQTPPLFMMTYTLSFPPILHRGLCPRLRFVQLTLLLLIKTHQMRHFPP